MIQYGAILSVGTCRRFFVLQHARKKPYAYNPPASRPGPLHLRNEKTRK